MTFQLDERLQNDCFEIAQSETSILLLMNNAAVPWFILVPKVEANELHDLPHSTFNAVTQEIRLLGQFIRKQQPVEKINVAAIGNVVNQLHIHIIGRWRNDYCWPDVVWGREAPAKYKSADVVVIQSEVVENLTDYFK